MLALEGPDGSGKTTLERHITMKLAQDGQNVINVSFPGHIPNSIGEAVYELHHKQGAVASAAALQAAHVAAHIETIEGHILPALDQGKTVILDRFWWSTIAYGQAAGLSMSYLRKLVDAELICWNGSKPDLIVLLTSELPRRNDVDIQEYITLRRFYLQLISEEKNSKTLEINGGNDVCKDVQLILDVFNNPIKKNAN
jgi:dTMP kinase